MYFRIDLGAFSDSYSEEKLLKWANRFFEKVAWKKPLLHAKLDDADYSVKKLQRLMVTNLKNWGAKSSKRYQHKWIVQLSPWEYAQASPGNALLASNRLERLAAILSPEAAGLRALKDNAEDYLAKTALDRAKAQAQDFMKEYDKVISNPRVYNDPEAMAPLKAQERFLMDVWGRKQKLYEEAVARKRRRTS